MDDALRQLLDARFLPALVPASLAVKLFVGWLRVMRSLDGNVVQTAAYLIAFPVMGAVAWGMGIFDHGFGRPEVFGWVLASLITGAAAIGVHETMTDRNP